MNVHANSRDQKVMYFVSCYLGLTSSYKLSWHYFGTWHGKGEWDSVGVVVKRALKPKQLRYPQRRLQDAVDVLEFMKKIMFFWAPNTYEGSRFSIAKDFWNVMPNDANRSTLHLCDHIPSSQKLHSIFGFSPTDPTMLLIRSLSCFYAPYIDQDWEKCEVTSHAPL
jgi:hypothetical protein